MKLPPQTRTPHALTYLPEKEDLVTAFVGTPVDELRTPALLIDRAIFKENCDKMHSKASAIGATFRAHVKSHKTVEGTRLQLEAGRTQAVVVSTMMEAWKLVEAGLFDDESINDILYPLPLPLTLLSDLSSLQSRISMAGASLRIMVDHPSQVEAVEEFEKISSKEPGYSPKWSVFLKANSGGNRAGLYPDDPTLRPLLEKILNSPHMTLFGVYVHAGQSYASTSQPQALGFLMGEVETADAVSRLANEIVDASPELSKRYAAPSDKRWVLSGSTPLVTVLYMGARQLIPRSVGSTPTANSAEESFAELSSPIELHAGNYPLLDCQQVHTTLVKPVDVSCSVLSTVISFYPSRGKVDGQSFDEMMCDAGALAMSKDTGPEKGFGAVVGHPDWALGRVSQEHGILTTSKKEPSVLLVGQKIALHCQHACLTLAGYPFFYIVDRDVAEGKEVVDIWVPWKGW